MRSIPNLPGCWVEADDPLDAIDAEWLRLLDEASDYHFDQSEFPRGPGPYGLWPVKGWVA